MGKCKRTRKQQCMSKIWIYSWRYSSSRIRRQIYRFGRSAKITHGYSYEWTGSQQPHLIKNARKVPCNTENYVPIVVRGLSTGSCSSCAESTASTSVALDSIRDNSTPKPAKTRRRCKRRKAWEDLEQDPNKNKNKKQRQRWGTGRPVAGPAGMVWRSSLTI